MKFIALLPLSCAASWLVCEPFPAQESRRDPSARETTARDNTQCHYLKVSEMVGANVYNAATADHPKNEKALGDVKDLIVCANARPTGAGGHGALVIASDGELFCLGNDAHHGVFGLRWDGKGRGFSVDTTATTAHLDGTGNRGTTAEAGAARSDRMGKNEGADAAAPKRLILWSGLKGLKVYPQGSNDSCGKVDDLWIDCNGGGTGYLVVSTGGVLGVGDTLRLVPWSIASVDRNIDEKANRVTLKTTKDVLEAAPKVESKTEANDAYIQAQACKNFSCEDPNKPGLKR